MEHDIKGAAAIRNKTGKLPLARIPPAGSFTFKGRFTGQIGETDYTVTGDLTIRGITQAIVMDVDYLGRWATPFWVGNEDKGPKTRAGFTGTTKINRQDFDMSWQGDLEQGGVVVGNEVFITVDAEALLEDG